MALHENIRFFAATDVGRMRKQNEDNYLIDKKLGLFIVADGMGGHAGGEIASALAVRTIHEELKRERGLIEEFEAGEQASSVTSKDILQLLEFAVQRASARIYDEAQLDFVKHGMGTTLSAILLVGKQGFVAHVGDSRIYMMREGRVQQITEDHTVSNELMKRGKLTQEQINKVGLKNAITRAVGVYESVEVDTLLLEIVPGDTYLLCSDGLHGYIYEEEEIASFLLKTNSDQGVLGLIELANQRGGRDNITALVIHMGISNEDDTVRARRVAQKRELLAQFSLFSRLSDRELLCVMQLADVRVYPSGAPVITEGEQGDELFIVLSGQLRVSRGGAMLSLLGPGDHVGEMALIRNVPRSATVTSEGPSELVAIRREDFFEILRKERELAIKLLWQFVGVLADRLDQTSQDLLAAREGPLLEDITERTLLVYSPEDVSLAKLHGSAVSEPPSFEEKLADLIPHKEQASQDTNDLDESAQEIVFDYEGSEHPLDREDEGISPRSPH